MMKDSIVAQGASTATNWALMISVFSLIISLTAVSVGFWQAKNNIAELRRARPNVRGTVMYVKNLVTGSFGTHRALMINLTNLGKEPTTIVGMVVYENHGKQTRLLNVGPHCLLDGPSLPLKLETHSPVNFSINLDEFSADRIFVLIWLGHGKNLEATVEVDRNLSNMRSSERSGIASGMEY